MTKVKGKMRTWVEKRLTGKITDEQWNILRGKYSNPQIRSLSRERALKIIER